ncbi:MAG: TIM barrel protein [Eubacteriales bacterium]|nr:TIM barrel protein [Eubacteriales bacterium]
MRHLPECRSMNFAVYSGMLDRFQDSRDIEQYYKQGGLNGLEIILAGESDQGKIRPDMVNGVHLFFHIFWMDFWLGEYKRLDHDFDSRDQWIQYYGGMDRESFLEPFRKDLDYAEEIGAKYVVFHVSEVTLRESYTYKYRYTNRQVIDAAIEAINMLLAGKNYSFEFLVENLWWSGFTMKDPYLTRRLIEGIQYEKKGIMLDIGHYMNTNCRLRTAEDAVTYLNKMIDNHEKKGFPVTDWIKGIHLQMSLGGAYKMRQKKEWKNGNGRLDFDQIPFYELYTFAYNHANQIDLHQPFIGEGVKELIERMDPKYVTFEFRQDSREEYEEFIKAQGKLLGYVDERDLL